MKDFTITGKTEYSSPPFYTGPEGYHMSVRVGTKDDHVSLYVCIMEGKHDKYLAWPFAGEITVTLLNQVWIRNHNSL